LQKKKPGLPYGYGYDRFEVLSAFSNSIFLFFVAVFLIMESLHRLYEPTDLHAETAYLAFIGFVVDSIGLFLLWSYSTFQTKPTIQQTDSGSRGHDCNMHSVYLHALTDLFVRFALIFATWMHAWREWAALNSFIFLVAACLIIRAILPLFQAMSLILLQTTPPHLQSALDQCLREIRYLEGVLECRNVHWWTQSLGVTVGSLHVRVTSTSNEQQILATVHKSLKKYYYTSYCTD